MCFAGITVDDEDAVIVRYNDTIKNPKAGVEEEASDAETSKKRRGKKRKGAGGGGQDAKYARQQDQDYSGGYDYGYDVKQEHAQQGYADASFHDAQDPNMTQQIPTMAPPMPSGDLNEVRITTCTTQWLQFLQYLLLHVLLGYSPVYNALKV